MPSSYGVERDPHADADAGILYREEDGSREMICGLWRNGPIDVRVTEAGDNEYEAVVNVSDRYLADPALEGLPDGASDAGGIEALLEPAEGRDGMAVDVSYNDTGITVDRSLTGTDFDDFTPTQFLMATGAVVGGASAGTIPGSIIGALLGRRASDYVSPETPTDLINGLRQKVSDVQHRRRKQEMLAADTVMDGSRLNSDGTPYDVEAAVAAHSERFKDREGLVITARGSRRDAFEYARAVAQVDPEDLRQEQADDEPAPAWYSRFLPEKQPQPAVPLHQ